LDLQAFVQVDLQAAFVRMPMAISHPSQTLQWQTTSLLMSASYSLLSALSDLAAFVSDEALLPKFIVTLSAVGGPPLKPCFTCCSEAVAA
jgi:hypothetical protein